MRNDDAGTRKVLAVFRGISLAVTAIAITNFGVGTVGSVAEAATVQRAGATEKQSVFDDSVVHRISVRFDETAYDEMIETFTTTGDKDWIEATVKLDGTTFKRAGIRLKGNSSLGGLGRAPAGAGGGVGGAANQPLAGAGSGANQLPAGAVGGPGGGASADTPEKLPWLVRLDEFVDGKDYHGVSELVVRSNSSETSLNEAVALELLGKAGMATQKAAYTRFAVNGSDAVLRLIVENPSDTWDAANFTSDGILYKAESGGDWSYRGDDPTDYDGIFDQETHTDDEDLTPLIAFLDFINNADDTTFATELSEHLDVKAFASYLAFEDLIVNFDDIDGPGNNAYLRYDEDKDQFTVLAWDHNLAFGSFGGGAGNTRGGLNGNVVPPAGNIPLPQGGGAGPGLGRGPAGRTNILVQRFKANTEFAALYDTALETLRSALFASGTATTILESHSGLLRTKATDLVDDATITSEAASISRYFTNT